MTKHPKRSGNPAARAAAVSGDVPSEAQQRKLFELAFRDVVGSLLLAGWRLSNPAGIDMSDKLAEEFGIQIPEKKTHESKLLVVNGGQVEERVVPKLVVP